MRGTDKMSWQGRQSVIYALRSSVSERGGRGERGAPPVHLHGCRAGQRRASIKTGSTSETKNEGKKKGATKDSLARTPDHLYETFSLSHAGKRELHSKHAQQRKIREHDEKRK